MGSDEMFTHIAHLARDHYREILGPFFAGAHFQIFSGGNFRVMRGGDLFGAGLHFVPRERKNIKFFWACCVLPYFNSVHFA